MALIGFRAWNFYEGSEWKLMPTGYTSFGPWPIGDDFAAKCPKDCGSTPSKNCTCGIHVWYTVDLVKKFAQGENQLIGAVQCWGKTLDHGDSNIDEGFRCQFARIIAFAAPNLDSIIKDRADKIKREIMRQFDQKLRTNWYQNKTASEILNVDGSLKEPPEGYDKAGYLIQPDSMEERIKLWHEQVDLLTGQEAASIAARQDKFQEIAGAAGIPIVPTDSLALVAREHGRVHPENFKPGTEAYKRAKRVWDASPH